MKNKGFSLVEVLIAVAIIALLAVIAIPNLLINRVNSNETYAQATLKSISNALENFYSINTVYPTDPNDLIGVNPPYLNKDYFTGIHHGYTFTHSLQQYSYTVIAAPISSSQGKRSFTISTGAVLTAE